VNKDKELQIEKEKRGQSEQVIDLVRSEVSKELEEKIRIIGELNEKIEGTIKLGMCRKYIYCINSSQQKASQATSK
jgi:hypothetical protein